MFCGPMLVTDDVAISRDFHSSRFVIDSSQVLSESGENPLRTRHCKRGRSIIPATGGPEVTHAAGKADTTD